MKCCFGALAFVISSLAVLANPCPDTFRNPSVENRPWTYWMWVNGNVDEASITKDLENIRDIGFGGVLMFDNRGYEKRLTLPPVDIEVMTERWFDLVAHSIRECARLGLVFTMNASSCGGSLKGFRDGREYEVDVTDATAVRAHLDAMIGPIVQRVPESVGKTFTHLYSVSWEGRIKPIGETAAALCRRVRESFYGSMRGWAHEHGFKMYSESGGPWQLAPEFRAGADQQEFLAVNDMPQGEFWVTDGHPAGTTDAPYHLRGAALSAALNGQPFASAESFTHMTLPYSVWPAKLKRPAHEAFADGVNHLVWHTYTCSPDRFGEPGLEYFAGTHVNRHTTWNKDVRPFVDYLARCQYLLRRGQPRMNLPSATDRHYLHFGHYDGLFADAKDCAVPDGWRYSHRRDGDCDIYFVMGNGLGTVQFGVKGKTVEIWDPADGSVRTAACRESAEGCAVDVSLPEDGAVFVVFTEPPKQKWTIEIGTKTLMCEDLFDWTTREETKLYSGTAVYRTSFEGVVSSVSLGEVKGGTARVVINGMDCGVAWCPPWKVRVPSSASHVGRNNLEVRVTNTWRNRLIGDCFESPENRVTKTRLKYFRPGERGHEFGDECRGYSQDDPLESSGLMGPVIFERN